MGEFSPEPMRDEGGHLLPSVPDADVSPRHTDVLANLVARLEDALEKKLEEIEQRLRTRTTLRKMFTERDLAELLQCDVRTVRRLEKAGDLPAAIRFGGSKRWRVRTIEEWLDGMAEEPHR